MDVQTLIAIISAIFASTGFWTFVQNAWNRESDESKLIMGLAFAEICRRCKSHIRDGYITQDDYQDLMKYFYDPYRNRGGDGTAERMVEEVKRLPLKVEDEK